MIPARRIARGAAAPGGFMAEWRTRQMKLHRPSFSTMTSRLQATLALGQHLWLDNLSRELMRSGQLQAWLEAGVQGITTNPAIFQKAISGGEGYADDLARLRASGLDAEARYEALAIADVQQACDALAVLHRDSGGDAGWVSLEVSPHLANDASGTVAAAVRLSAAVARPNLLIKIPSTPAGLEALTEATARGINVNMTLIFSLPQAVETAKAWAAGARRWLAGGGDPAQLYSVASVFLSRVDTVVDPLLEAQGSDAALALRGRCAIAMARLCYQRYLDLFARKAHPAAFADLAQAGVRPQRLLWASTGTKNAAYSDTLYVDALIGPDTVNTVPEATLKAFADHGTPATTLTADVAAAESALLAVKGFGIDLTAIGERLQADGLVAFEQAYDQILATV
jgi:transaldolase